MRLRPVLSLGLLSFVSGMITRRFSVARFLAPLALATVLAVACGGSADAPGPTNPGPTGPGPDAEIFTHPAGTPTGKVTIPDWPHSVDISAGGTVFVTRLDANAVSRFLVDAPGTPLAPIALPTATSDVVFDRAGTLAYVGSLVAGDNGVYVIDVATGVVKSTLWIGSVPYHIALSLDESRVFVAGSLSRVWSAPTAGGAATAAVLSGAMEGVAVSRSGGGLFAANENGIVRRLEPTSLAVQETSVPIGFLGDIAVSPDGSQVWVVTQDAVVALSASTLTPIAFVSIGDGTRGMAISPDGQQLYVTTYLGELVIVDRVQRAVVKRIRLGGQPAHVAFDHLGKTAVVANEDGWVDIIK